MWILLLLLLLQNDIFISSESCTSLEYYTVQKTHQKSLKTYVAYKTRSKLSCCPGFSGIYPACELICNEGYEVKEGACEPVCDNCLEGSCYEPDRCDECNPGYELENESCIPICSNGCDHGWCSIPEYCECNFGYIENDNNQCEPHCENGCLNGRCIGPDNCVCENGLKLINNVCQPYCDVRCENGFCPSPNECICHQGYSNSMHFFNNNCQPICDNCEHGVCLSPGNCECYPEFSMGNGLCGISATQMTTSYPKAIDNTTNTIPELSSSVSESSSTSESSVTENIVEDVESEYSTHTIFKDDFTSDSGPAVKFEQILNESHHVFPDISHSESSRKEIPWVGLAWFTVVIVLIMFLGTGVYIFNRNKRQKAKRNSQFLVRFEKTSEDNDFVLFQN